MPSFSKGSRSKLITAHPDLQRLFNEVIKHWDCTITCGSRTEEEQEQLFEKGRTTVHFPNSKHNGSPSKAIDVVPYPINYKFEGELKKAAKAENWDEYNKCLHNIEEWAYFIGFVKGIAQIMGIKIRVGADWDSDHQMSDQRFDDWPHVELIN